MGAAVAGEDTRRARSALNVSPAGVSNDLERRNWPPRVRQVTGGGVHVGLCLHWWMEATQMHQLVRAMIVLPALLGMAVLPSWSPPTWAHEGDGWPSGHRWQRAIPEMLRGMGMAGPWWYGRGDHEGPLISLMLAWKEQLGLTAAQERTLRELRANFEKEAVRRSSEIEVAELELKGLLEQETVDLGKVEEQAKKIALLRADLRVARIKTIEAGKALLTQEQRRKFERFGHDQRPGGGMGMMMPPWGGWAGPPWR